jgi:Fe-S-cluster containining protein
MTSVQDNQDEFQASVLRDAPRLDRTDAFEFGCHADLSCFNTCCRDLTVELSPYDVLRLKSGLGLKSGEFLRKHTLTRFDSARGLPVVFLAMNPDALSTCPFVSERGCSVYENRPAACRLYPVGRAVTPAKDGAAAEEFFFLLEEDPCVGYAVATGWTIQKWLDDQGVSDCERWDTRHRQICQHPALRKRLADGNPLTPASLNEYHLALYNLDRFREYVLRAELAEKADLSMSRRARIASEDEALLDFALDWFTGRLFAGNAAACGASATQAASPKTPAPPDQEG